MTTTPSAEREAAENKFEKEFTEANSYAPQGDWIPAFWSGWQAARAAPPAQVQESATTYCWHCNSEVQVVAGGYTCETCIPSAPPPQVQESDLKILVNALLHQIDIGDFVDSNGHSAKMLKPVHDLLAALGHVAPPALPASQEPVGYLPVYELGRLRSGHDARLRSAKFGPSALDGDVPVFVSQHPAVALAGQKACVMSPMPKEDGIEQGWYFQHPEFYANAEKDADGDWMIYFFDKKSEQHAYAEHSASQPPAVFRLYPADLICRRCEEDFGSHEGLNCRKVIGKFEPPVSQPPAVQGVTAGWQLVPIEPTENMVIDGFESAPDRMFDGENYPEGYDEMGGCQQAAFRAKRCYAAMLAAAPQLGEQND